MNDDVGYMLKKVNDRIHIQADANLKECGLTFSQMRVLMVLRKNGGQVSQKMIEEELGVAHPTVVGIVSRLEKNGFVSCYMDPADRRSKIVCETEKALENHRKHKKHADILKSAWNPPYNRAVSDVLLSFHLK